MHALLKNDYFEPKPVPPPDWDRHRNCSLGKLISDSFKAINRGHNPQNSIWMGILSMYSSMYSKVGVMKLKRKCELILNAE